MELPSFEEYLKKSIFITYDKEFKVNKVGFYYNEKMFNGPRPERIEKWFSIPKKKRDEYNSHIEVLCIQSNQNYFAYTPCSLNKKVNCTEMNIEVVYEKSGDKVWISDYQKDSVKKIFPSFPMLEKELQKLYEEKCNYCKKITHCKLCGKCKKVMYCSIDCQKTHWVEHKHICCKS